MGNVFELRKYVLLVDMGKGWTVYMISNTTKDIALLNKSTISNTGWKVMLTEELP